MKNNATPSKVNSLNYIKETKRKSEMKERAEKKELFSASRSLLAMAMATRQAHTQQQQQPPKQPKNVNSTQYK